jgi:hypothetical protein
MPDGAERRRLHRMALELPLQHKLSVAGDAGVGVGWTRDLSEAGACVELPEFLQPQLSLQLRLHTDRGPFETEAQVVWDGEAQAVWPGAAGGIRGGVLHGVAFTALSPPDRHMLHTLLHSSAEEGSAVRLPLQVSATCQLEGQEEPSLEGVTAAISRQDLCLGLPHMLPPGTTVRITLQTPDEPLAVSGNVIQVRPTERARPEELIQHTVQFARLGWHAALYLALLLTASS